MATPASPLTAYLRPAESIPVLGTWDVIVCGAGPAGCAAAYASARQGARTLLLERGGAPGGAPVTQHVLPILSTNGRDFQGVWHLWARTLRKYDGIAGLVRDTRHGGSWLRGAVDPEGVKFAWEEILGGAGVEVLYLAAATDAILDGGAIAGVVASTRGGPRALCARRVVDATGDAEVFARAGAGWEEGSDGHPWTQAVSLNGWYGGSAEAAPEWHRFPGISRAQTGLQRLLRVDPLDPFAISRAMRDGRQCILRRLRDRKAWDPGVFLAGSADNPGVRASRRISGVARATADDAWNFRRHDDGIARCSWEIDIHLPDRATGKGVEFDSPAYAARLARAAAGDWFDIRYGCLVSKDVDGLLAAGRCISSDVVAQSCLRIQQTCMATGEAAGLAAATSLAAGLSPRALDTAALAAALERARDVEPAFDIPS